MCEILIALIDDGAILYKLRPGGPSAPTKERPHLRHIRNSFNRDVSHHRGDCAA